MEVRFWKEGKLLLFFALPLFLLVAITISIIIICVDTGILGAIIMCLVCLSSLVPFLIKKNWDLVYLSISGITVKRFKKIISTISWQQVKDVEIKYSGYTPRYLSFIYNSTQIDISINKKLYEAVLKLCSNVNIKEKVLNLKEFDKYKIKR